MAEQAIDVLNIYREQAGFPTASCGCDTSN